MELTGPDTLKETPDVAHGTTPVVIDEVQLGRLEREFADAADTLESVERLCRSEMTGSTRAESIRSLVADGRFEVGQVDRTALSSPSRLRSGPGS